MTTKSDDTAHASALLAESVIALARAEIHLAFSTARVAGERLLFTLALTALALLFAQAAFTVLVLSPVLWSFRAGPTLVALGISFGVASSISLLAIFRWRSFGKRHRPKALHPAAVSELGETRA